ncbi:MAG TPA: TatD family hydrolase [Dyella sp.]|uniref:TatD family hydrolase n=1 Tax=Dyella sp. TaxID=1869338 RepID=UPI002F925C6C
MPLQLIDSHVHLDDASFDPDRPEVIERAHAAGVTAQVIPGIDAASWTQIRQLCEGNRGLYPAYGLHPLFLARHRPEHIEQLPTWLARGDAVAVGEIGLDFFVDGLPAEDQRFYFQRQLAIAREANLPVILHARKALEEVTLTLRRTGGLRGVVHSFSGSEEQARQLFELGFYIGIGGPITYERARRLRRVIATMPIDYLLLETDSPDQPLSTHRGQRNEPGYLSEVLAAVASLRGESIEAIAAATTANASRLFEISAS